MTNWLVGKHCLHFFADTGLTRFGRELDLDHLSVGLAGERPSEVCTCLLITKVISVVQMTKLSC